MCTWKITFIVNCCKTLQFVFFFIFFFYYYYYYYYCYFIVPIHLDACEIMEHNLCATKRALSVCPIYYTYTYILALILYQ